MNTEAHLTDTETVELWGLVIRGFYATDDLLHQRIKQEFDLGNTEAETMITLHLAAGHRAPMSNLAKATSSTTGGFTKIADRLTSRGLVERVACAEDRRVTYLALTSHGSTFAERLVDLVANFNREHFISVLGANRARLVAEAMVDLFRANHG